MSVKDYESKTQAKAAMHDLQRLGDRLAGLPLPTLRTFDLPERLYDAFEVLSRTRGHEGLRRQKQWIGKLMRTVDTEPIEARLALLFQSTHEAKATFKRCEQWRDKLLESPEALEAFCNAFPAAKRDVLTRLINEARAEKTAEKPPKHARLLFRAVTAVVTAIEKEVSESDNDEE